MGPWRAKTAVLGTFTAGILDEPMFSLKVYSPSVPPYVGFSPASGGGAEKALITVPFREGSLSDYHRLGS